MSHRIFDVSTTEAATMLGVHPRTVMRWCDAGKVEARRAPDGRRWLLNRDDLHDPHFMTRVYGVVEEVAE